MLTRKNRTQTTQMENRRLARPNLLIRRNSTKALIEMNNKFSF